MRVLQAPLLQSSFYFLIFQPPSLSLQSPIHGNLSSGDQDRVATSFPSLFILHLKMERGAPSGKEEDLNSTECTDANFGTPYSPDHSSSGAHHSYRRFSADLHLSFINQAFFPLPGEYDVMSPLYTIPWDLNQSAKVLSPNRTS